MMGRLLTAFKADILFQIKQGFYFVYALLAFLYLILLTQFDQNVVRIMLPIIIYIDPSVLGLFFIGGITLLEKEQGILSLIHVTPLRVWEYMASKLLSLGLLSLIVGISISLFSYHKSVNYLLLIIGILLTSLFYTLVGFIIASKAKSVNSFFIGMVPPMVSMILPCFLLILKPNMILLDVIPSIASFKLILASYLWFDLFDVLLCLVSITAFDILLLYKARSIFVRRYLND